VRRSLVVIAVVLAAGCADGDGGGLTDLNVQASDQGRSVSYEFRCDPPRGDVPRPGVLCAALEADAELLLETPPPPPPEIHNGRVSVQRCLSGIPSFRVAGTYRGREVDARFVGCTPAEQPGLTSWADLLGIGLVVDPALEPLWAASRRTGRGRVESLSRVTARDLSIYEPLRRFRVKYESRRCEIWLVRRAGESVRVERHARERPCYALAPWRRKRP
jgi:hypothetical protein